MQTSSGEWVEAPFEEDSIILIPGETLEIWSNGDVKATVSFCLHTIIMIYSLTKCSLNVHSLLIGLCVIIIV